MDLCRGNATVLAASPWMCASHIRYVRLKQFKHLIDTAYHIPY